jgi:hypothetical protein
MAPGVAVDRVDAPDCVVIEDVSSVCAGVEVVALASALVSVGFITMRRRCYAERDDSQLPRVVSR